MDHGVELRVLEWRPHAAATKPPVLFVPGWVSVVEGWVEVLRALVADRRVIYLETREKRSATFRRQLTADDFRIPRLAEDIRVAWRELGVPDGTVLFASSMGSNAILEALKDGGISARAAFLIGPNAALNVPWWGPLLFKVPVAAYGLVRAPVAWYLRHFRVNSREDPDQMRRYERTLREAEPARLRLSARAIVGYTAWPDLERIEIPVALAYAPSDTLHGGDDVEQLAMRIPGGRTVPCASNTAMHRAEVVAELDRFVDDLEA